MKVAKVLPIAMALLLGASVFAQDDFAKIEVRGTLHNDVERGVTTLKSDGVTYVVDFGRNQDMLRSAERHDRHTVVMSGRLLVEAVKDSCPRLVVAAERFAEVAEAVRVEERPIVRQETVIVREREPFIKVGPLEIK